MKRDMDIVRRIALETMEMEHGYALDGLDGVDKAVFSFHVELMEEAGLIKASIQPYASGAPARALVHRLTWAGCEFADAARNDTIWSKAKEHVMKPSMSFTFDVLKEWLKAEIIQGFPTSRAFAQQIT